jgi:ArsR family transcriptional regulator
MPKLIKTPSHAGDSAKTAGETAARTGKALSDAALTLIASRFRALAEPVRLRLLNTLMEGELTVGQLAEIAGTGQANVSKHLAVLKEARMIATRREGLSTWCSIADASVFQLCEIMCARLKAEHEERARQLEGV